MFFLLTKLVETYIIQSLLGDYQDGNSDESNISNNFVEKIVHFSNMKIKEEKRIAEKLTPELAKKRYIEMMEQKRALREHFRNGGSLSDVDTDRFQLVKPF